MKPSGRIDLDGTASTHTMLVRRAIRWLYGSQRCTAVVSEASPAYSGEIVDALGWQADTLSILVECKASLGDFYADRRKLFRQEPALGVGRYRWYLTMPGLLSDRIGALPEHWGLLEARPKTVKVVRAAMRQTDINVEREMKFLMDSRREERP